MKNLRLFCVCVIFFASGILSLWSEETVYIFKKGDTLYKVSREYNVPVDVLVEYNHIRNPQAVPEGLKILIPSIYTVQKGDTFYSIAMRFSLSADVVMKANSITNPGSLKIGQRLYIPGAGNSASRVSSTTAAVTTNNTVASLVWPHPGRRETYNNKVSGILINGEKGDLVYSSCSGRVIWANPYRGYGNVALVYSPNGLVYGYLGAEQLVVSVGEQVEAGSAIGRMGMYFHETDAKLLFFVFNNQTKTYMDPSQVLQKR